MMYHACSKPGKNPSMQRAMLITESALQRPRLTQTRQEKTDVLALWSKWGKLSKGNSWVGRSETGGKCQYIPAIGGNRMAISPRKISLEHIVM